MILNTNSETWPMVWPEGGTHTIPHFLIDFQFILIEY